MHGYIMHRFNVYTEDIRFCIVLVCPSSLLYTQSRMRCFTASTDWLKHSKLFETRRNLTILPDFDIVCFSAHSLCCFICLCLFYTHPQCRWYQQHTHRYTQKYPYQIRSRYIICAHTHTSVRSTCMQGEIHILPHYKIFCGSKICEMVNGKYFS